MASRNKKRFYHTNEELDALSFTTSQVGFGDINNFNNQNSKVGSFGGLSVQEKPEKNLNIDQIATMAINP